jgi:hypothetical protein
MVKQARYINDITNEPFPHYEPQLVALKATTNKEALPDRVAQVEATDLNEEEMAVMIKHFRTALKGHKDYSNKNKSRESVHASSTVSPIILLLKVLIMKMTRTKTRKRRRSSIEIRRARRTLEKNGTQAALNLTPTTKDLLPMPSTSPPSSPMSITLASWQKRRRYTLMIPQVHFL